MSKLDIEDLIYFFSTLGLTIFLTLAYPDSDITKNAVGVIIGSAMTMLKSKSNNVN